MRWITRTNRFGLRRGFLAYMPGPYGGTASVCPIQPKGRDYDHFHLSPRRPEARVRRCGRDRRHGRPDDRRPGRRGRIRRARCRDLRAPGRHPARRADRNARRDRPHHRLRRRENLRRRDRGLRHHRHARRAGRHGSGCHGRRASKAGGRPRPGHAVRPCGEGGEHRGRHRPVCSRNAHPLRPPSRHQPAARVCGAFGRGCRLVHGQARRHRICRLHRERLQEPRVRRRQLPGARLAFLG